MSKRDDRFGDPDYADELRGGSSRRGGDSFFDDAGFTADPPTRTSTRMTPLGGRLEDEDDVFDEIERERAPWHTGADIGLLLLRLVLGGGFIAHGLQQLFGFVGGQGQTQFIAQLVRLGYRESHLLSWVAGVTEIAGGALLVLGLFTPFAAAALLAVLANVLRFSWHGGVSKAFGEDTEFKLLALIALVLVTILFAGAGRISLDGGRPWYRHPLASAFVAILLGASATFAALFVYHN
ncbi:DoxX family protein [Pseudonocardiaceae bacterium YIM PH 21723]|nr:DoxX family protein [Pseudonocardiaceae bacterium YIM PH 21723]